MSRGRTAITSTPPPVPGRGVGTAVRATFAVVGRVNRSGSRPRQVAWICRLRAAPCGRTPEGGPVTGRWTLPDDRIPSAWFNVAPHLPEPLAPPLHPATRQPVGPDDLAPLFPMALIGQEVSAEPWIDIPGPGARHPAPVATDPAGPGPAPGGGPGHAGPHLLQGRVGLAGRLPQAQHRRGPGVLQRPGGDPPAEHRDRRRPVGERPLLRLGAVRPGVQGLHGAGLLPAKAVPAGDDGDLGRLGRALAGRRSRPSRIARHRHQRRRA